MRRLFPQEICAAVGGTLLQCGAPVTGVTTEVCVHATTREANDRGYECLVVSDATASYFPKFHRVALEMITAQGGILGWVADSATVCAALAGTAP